MASFPRPMLALAILAMGPSLAWPHVRLLYPRPRVQASLKVGPCGGVARTSSPIVLEAGSRIEVEWDEFVDHPGYYQIFFSTGGDRDFLLLVDGIEDRRPPASGPNLYRVTVTLPATPCEGTLQLIQVMTENPSRPSLYFSCADVRLVEPGRDFRRGDATNDGKVGVEDAVVTLEHLFGGRDAPACRDAADANDDGEIDVSDPIRILVFLFAGGSAPPSPGPGACGSDPAPDALGCSEYEACGA
jgi:hypothetical protein